METITISQLLSMSFYSHGIHITNVEESDAIKDSHGNDMRCWITGSAKVVNIDGFTIQFNWWGVGGKKPNYDVFDYEVYLNIDNPSFELINAILVDNNGRILEIYKQHEAFKECLRGVNWQEEVIDLLPLCIVEKVDGATEQAEDPDNFLFVRRNNDRSLCFEGDRLAHATSSKVQTANMSSNGSRGPRGRWTEINLYRSNGGKYVCERIDYIRDLKLLESSCGAVCDTFEQAFEFFSRHELAEKPYEAVDIEDSIYFKEVNCLFKRIMNQHFHY